MRHGLNPHSLFIAHVVLFIVGSSVIWSLDAPVTERQLDTLLWLVVVCAHGLLLYRRIWIGFIYHLLLFSAGTAALWTMAGLGWLARLVLTLVWIIGAGIIGLFLYRMRMHREVMTYVDAVIDSDQTLDWHYDDETVEQRDA